MHITDFITDQERVATWIENVRRSMEEEGWLASHWPHADGRGFGMSFVADSVGEFRVLADGTVDWHVDRYDPAASMFTTLDAVRRRVAHVHEFEALYVAFRRRMFLHPGGCAGT